LANVTVSNMNDVVNGNTASIAALVASDGGDGISLREAILAANADSAADVINFGSLTGAIQLTNIGHAAHITIGKPLAVNGPGSNRLAIHGYSGTEALGDGGSVFSISDGTSSLQTISISGLSITGADPVNSGGAIVNFENLLLTDCLISGNQGVGISSTFYTTNVTVSNTTITSNAGGGIRGANILITQSSINGNSIGANQLGAGVNGESVTIIRSTISNNLAIHGTLSSGGGVYGRTVTIINSTVSGNSAVLSGGGVEVGTSIKILNSTIAGNTAGSFGGGIFGGSLTMTNSVLAGNSANTSNPELAPTGTLDVDYSLIQNTSGLSAPQLMALNGGTGNVLDENPLLSNLADNGGRTKTHGLLTGSPAIDAGDPNFDPADPDGDPMTDDALPFDQRGAPFARVFNGRIDIGAVERQPIPPAVFGDYNDDGTANAADYTVWRNTLGQTGLALYSGADGNGDGMITRADYDVWKQRYGETVNGLGAGSTEQGAGSFAGSLRSALPATAADPSASAASLAVAVEEPAPEVEVANVESTQRLRTRLFGIDTNARSPEPVPPALFNHGRRGDEHGSGSRKEKGFQSPQSLISRSFRHGGTLLALLNQVQRDAAINRMVALPEMDEKQTTDEAMEPDATLEAAFASLGSSL
jgi:hypothetical protein